MHIVIITDDALISNDTASASDEAGSQKDQEKNSEFIRREHMTEILTLIIYSTHSLLHTRTYAHTVSRIRWQLRCGGFSHARMTFFQRFLQRALGTRSRARTMTRAGDSRESSDAHDYQRC